MLDEGLAPRELPIQSAMLRRREGLRDLGNAYRFGSLDKLTTDVANSGTGDLGGCLPTVLCCDVVTTGLVMSCVPTCTSAPPASAVRRRSSVAVR